ncbi:LysR family transcriptional regulator [Pseudomonas aeruginosa]|uniref:LysR family transcriptional regulator n=1 Tax=Gammaproteobacteria TaxID=1236 RepID=UPI001232598D|nr:MULTISPECIES: LysR family transcriptional regulator [Gammaproteobacteria]HBT5887337.1 LysR family transcriptional regulator [Klebsiella quasipneumoniae]HCI6316337.1 LysR family transcriptional regulator [Klebsiella quasipneumoniae subsp. similipneumoniae]KAA5629640.1 LysR family transcriptional regulator [Pseudomonas aeruginosa]MBN9702763.1 LysR family transcriptional regulator [Enterobacter roggenkampii]HBN8507694.1 LysR family transcriptional regulator [Pseudomonas aeruginosa]
MALRNLDDLAVFVHVVERQSFSAAARDLHLAPKTVSKQIARLEQALGTTLFERNTRNLRITDEGRAIAERARVALGVLEEVQELATGGSRELSGIIRLTAPMPFGRKFVAPAIHDFCRLHPRVGFDLRLSDQVQDLYSGDLDLAIRMGELADSRLVARRVAGNRRVLAASPAYLKAQGTPATPEDLAQHNCLVFAYLGLLQNTWPLRKSRREKSVTVGGTLCSDSGDVLHAWCLAGLGISLRETWDIHEELRNGRLMRVLPEWEAALSKISIVRARREPVPRRLTAFSDFLFERWHNAPWDR